MVSFLLFPLPTSFFSVVFCIFTFSSNRIHYFYHLKQDAYLTLLFPCPYWKILNKNNVWQPWFPFFQHWKIVLRLESTEILCGIQCVIFVTSSCRKSSFLWLTSSTMINHYPFHVDFPVSRELCFSSFQFTLCFSELVCNINVRGSLREWKQHILRERGRLLSLHHGNHGNIVRECMYLTVGREFDTTVWGARKHMGKKGLFNTLTAIIKEPYSLAFGWILFCLSTFPNTSCIISPPRMLSLILSILTQVLPLPFFQT